jgi:hypothetical protein
MSEPTSSGIVDGWTTDTKLVREFDRPVVVSDAVVESLVEAMESWPELRDTLPVAEFVDAEKLDGLFKTRAVDDTGHVPSLEFRFQQALVTVMYASRVRVIVERP